MNEICKDVPYIWTEKGLYSSEKIFSLNKIGGLNIHKNYCAPLAVTLELTTACNFRCIHCYNNSGSNMRNKLNNNEWKDLISQLKEMSIFECVLSGGEPFMEIQRLFYTLDKLSETAISLSINTNGSLLNEEIISEIKRYELSHIQISIDGANQSTHEKIRMVDCWRKIINSINLLVKAGISVQISFVINQINYMEISEMVKLSDLLGVKKIIFAFFESAGRANENGESLSLSKEQKRNIYDEIKNLYYKYKQKLSIQILPEKQLLIQLLRDGTNDNLVISADGNVKYNCFIEDVLGNVKNKSLREIWDEKGKYAWKR